MRRCPAPSLCTRAHIWYPRGQHVRPSLPFISFPPACSGTWGGFDFGPGLCRSACLPVSALARLDPTSDMTPERPCEIECDWPKMAALILDSLARIEKRQDHLEENDEKRQRRLDESFRKMWEAMHALGDRTTRMEQRQNMLYAFGAFGAGLLGAGAMLVVDKLL